MEFVFEFLFELILEGGIAASRSRKIPHCIRYPLIVIIVLFFLAVMGFIFWLGISLLKENLPFGIFFILLGLFMFVMSFIKFRKIYGIIRRKR